MTIYFPYGMPCVHDAYSEGTYPCVGRHNFVESPGPPKFRGTVLEVQVATGVILRPSPGGLLNPEPSRSESLRTSEDSTFQLWRVNPSRNRPSRS